MPSLRSIKKQIRAGLASPEWRSRVPAHFSLPRQMVATALIASLADHDPERKWRAASALGMLVARTARENPESGRETMRRLVWALNEESGAVGWGMPEAMGEIMRAHQGLAGEFFNLLASYLLPGPNQLDFPPLRKGAAWGASRVAGKWPDLARDRLPLECLAQLAKESDAELRAAAASLLSSLSQGQKPPFARTLARDTARVEFWDGESLRQAAVDDFLK